MLEKIKELPKIELHFHLDGSVPISIIKEISGKTEEEITKELNISLDKKGRIEVNENNQTSNKKIFAGGDISGTEGTVAFAARSGRNAANSIIEYLNNKSSK